MSILVLCVQGNLWGRKCLNNIMFFHVLLSSKLFSFLVKLFFGRAANRAIYESGDVFSRNDFFEETLCLYNFFQSLSGRNLDFCQLFWQRCQNCILRSRNSEEKRVLPKQWFQHCFWILSHKNWILRNEWLLRKNILLRIQRNIWSFYWKCK